MECHRMVLRIAVAVLTLSQVAAAGQGFEDGDSVYITVPRFDTRFTVEPSGFVHAFWHHRGKWQRFELEREDGPGPVLSGDTVLLKSWTGRRLTVQGSRVHASWRHAGAWQKFVIDAKGAEAGVPITNESTIFLTGHTGKRVDVNDGRVRARYSHKGAWQELALELHARRATTTASPPTTTTAPPANPQSDRCADLTHDRIPELLSTKIAELPAPIGTACGGSGSGRSCRHGFYAASPATDLHALLYNDVEGKAVLVLIDGDDDVAGTLDLGAQEVRGLQFEPDGEHVVALISGAENAPSTFVKVAVLRLSIVWTAEVQSPTVGMGKWTPDNTDAIAVSRDRYVLHSAGVCHEGSWCEGYQGDLMQVLNATTGAHLDAEGKDMLANRSSKQMVAYNPQSNTFMLANAAGSDIKGLQFRAFTNGEYLPAGALFESWADGRGKQGVTQGTIRAVPGEGGFAAAWSFGAKDGSPDKLYFAKLTERGAFATEPRVVFEGIGGTEVGAGLAALGGGRWLVGYTAADRDIIQDYMRVHWDDWGIPEEVRSGGSRLAVLDAEGRLLGAPVNVSALGAPIPVEINHLSARRGGIGWIAITGPGATTFTVARLRCRRDGEEDHDDRDDDDDRHDDGDDGDDFV